MAIKKRTGTLGGTYHLSQRGSATSREGSKKLPLEQGVKMFRDAFGG